MYGEYTAARSSIIEVLFAEEENRDPRRPILVELFQFASHELGTAERIIPPPHPKMINNSRSLNSSAETYCHASMVSAQYEGDFTHPSRHIYWAASADRIVNDPVVYVTGQAIGAVGVTG